MACFAQTHPLRIPPSQAGINWSTSWWRIPRLRRQSVSELGKKAVRLGMSKRQSIICEFLPRAIQTLPDFTPVVPTMMKVRAQWSGKGLNLASSTLRRAQALRLVMMTMSRAMLAGCMKTQTKLGIGMRAKVKMRQNLPQSPVRGMAPWMIGMYGVRETRKIHDTRLDFSVEFRCLLCFNYNFIAAFDRRLTHTCIADTLNQHALTHTASSTQRSGCL